MLRFVLTLFAAGVIVSGVAIAWPRLTSQPRPEPLTRVNDIVKNTPVGKNIANVLGISDNESVEPINIASVASSLSASLIKAAEDRAARIVVTQAVRQLASQFDGLPENDKKQIQEFICKSSTESASLE